ncbi:cache domain-containing sensor histidine kinase [Paenibacillus sp. sgz302251]|uniref:cache domain-containing sensor histidine kinase n=1 Tax=Paenibacillus sp. sgz302251 TaxID=3414493 RepID=UPI003C7D8021
MLFSLRSRLMLAFSLLLIIPFTTLVLLLSEESSEAIRGSIETSTSQTLEQFGSHLTTFLKQVEETGNQIMSNSVTQAWLTTGMNPDSTMEEKLMAKQRLVDYISSYSINNSSGISIGIYSDFSGGIWTQDRTYKDQLWHKQFKLENERWTGAHYDYDQADEVMKVRQVNSYVLPLVKLQSFARNGVVKINYPTTILRDSLDKIRLGSTGRAFLIKPDGSNVLDQLVNEEEISIVEDTLEEIKERSAKQSDGFFSVLHEGETHLLFYRYFANQNWYVIGAVPEKELFVKIDLIRRTMLIVGAGLVAVAMLFALSLSYGITRPLTAMARAMKHVERGEFVSALDMMPKVRTGHSEVGYVTRIFESMTNRLRYLIETEFESNLRRKNAEYKALLLQINPHFFNNTLEIIGGLAAMKRNDEVIDATEALGQMMRYSLDLKNDLVKVKEEMAYTRDYLLILKHRYANLLEVEMEEDGEAGELLIAKFLLQPIVENAVKYSLEKGGVARIGISVRSADGRLTMRVSDNGIGMKPEFVEELLTEMAASDKADILNSGGRSIGLRNVLSRCRLYYGKLLQLNIDSVPGEGTAITIEIPAVKG